MQPIKRYPLLYPVVALSVMAFGWLSFLCKQAEFFLVSPFWPVAGVSVAALMLLGLRFWPAVAIGYFAYEWGDYSFRPGHDLLVVLLFTSAHLLHVLLAVRISRNFIGPGVPELTRFRSVFLFIVGAGFLPALASTSVAMIILMELEAVSAQQIPAVACQWWVGDALGVLMVTPMVFSFFARPRKLWRPRRWLFTLPIVLALAGLGMVFRWVNLERIEHVEMKFQREALAVGLDVRAQLKEFDHSLDATYLFVQESNNNPDIGQFATFARWLMGGQSYLFSAHWLPIESGQFRSDGMCVRSVERKVRSFSGYLESCLNAEILAQLHQHFFSDQAWAEKIGLFNYDKNQWLVYRPVSTAHGQLAGLVMIEFDLSQMMGRVFREHHPEFLMIEIDQLEGDQKQPIFRSVNAYEHSSRSEYIGNYSKILPFNGADWLLQIRPATGYNEAWPTVLPGLVFLVSTLLVVLLLPLLLVGSGHNYRMARQIKRQTQQLAKTNQALLSSTAGLTRSNRYFQALLNNSPVPHVLLNRDGQAIMVNRAFSDAYRYYLADLKDFESWQQSVLKQADSAVSGPLDLSRSQSQELRLRHRQGDWRHVLRQQVDFAGISDIEPLTLITFYDISSRKHAEHALQVLAKTSSSSNDSFFSILAEQLAHWLEMPYVVVALADEEHRYAETLVVWGDGRIQEDFRYIMQGMPCQSVLRNQACTYVTDLREKFPNDAMLNKLAVDSYLGVPLTAGNGQHLGVLAAFDRKPIANPESMLAILQSMAGRAAAEIERRKGQQQLELAARIFHHAHEAIITTDARSRIIDVNPAFCRISGYSRDEVLGKTPRLLKSDRHSSAFFRKLWQSVKQYGFWQGEIWSQRKNGDLYAQHGTISALADAEGHVQYYIGMFSDVTEQKQQQELIWRQAHFDQLTELPNRSYFQNHLIHEINRCDRSGKSLALLFMDLDHFKEINDTLGHRVGDLLLQEVARRLTLAIRQTDTISRLGGDEFTVILPDLVSHDDAIKIAEKILSALSLPYCLDDKPVYISASVGLTFYPDDSDVPEALVQNADQAMYAAKNLGRNRYCCFTPEMKLAALERVQLLNDLRAAIDQKQFQLFYQPIVDFGSGEIVKAEALLRWPHPKWGWVSPSVFIPLAEQSPLIQEIGQWVFATVAQQILDWQVRFADTPQISINISPAQFVGDINNPKHWLKTLQQTGLSGRHVVIEITEGLLLDNNRQIDERLLAFRDAGIQVAIDDFGTGYSSLAYLKKFDIDYLKIDQTFVSQLSDKSQNLALCEAIIVMAHKLELKVIAEGVETNDQYRILRDMGCDFGQGYYFGKPMTTQSLELLLDGKQSSSLMPLADQVPE